MITIETLFHNSEFIDTRTGERVDIGDLKNVLPPPYVLTKTIGVFYIKAKAVYILTIEDALKYFVEITPTTEALYGSK